MRALLTPKIVFTIFTICALGNPVLADSLPKCADLRDSTERFYVELLSGRRSCKWVSRRDTIFRCNTYDETPQNCPLACNVECQTDEPSLSPSVSLSPSFSPSASPSVAPSLPPTDFPFCEDLEDTTERFYVEGTNGKGMRLCDWAKRRNTSERCQREVVREQCQIICNTPCRNRSDSPTLTPTKEVIGVAGLNEDVQAGNRSTRRQGVIIGCGVAGALCVIGIALYLLHSSNRKNSAVAYDLNEDSYSEGNESVALESTGSNEDKVASIKGDQPLPIAKTCSFIPANQKNLGVRHSQADVQCCGNFPCENCRMENNLTFVRVSKWNVFQRSRSWMQSQGKRNYDGGNMILSDLNSITSSNASSV
mmetsp:Transcript_198/g.300  ORF Transcript_198/g.300 Transcript_198/m.300 type:complete len:365 (-) Transcript_198:4715-5809(-)